MELRTSEKIKIILGRQSLNISDLADKLGQSRQNLTNKLSRDNFSEKELTEIAEALNCKYEGVFTLPNGEKL